MLKLLIISVLVLLLMLIILVLILILMFTLMTTDVDDEDYVDNESAFYAQANDDSDAEVSTRKVFLSPLMTSR
jgi:hypothetical protein